MDTFRKWLNKPKADDKSLLARFYHADRSLTAVASELDSFDGRAEPDRCSRLVTRLRQGQDKVLSITNIIMEELLGNERDPRAFRAKFPEEVLQDNLAGQLWFGAECLAAGSSIMNREQESKEMRPLAQAVTKTLGTVRTLLREQCLRNNVPNSKTLHLDVNDSTTEQLYESLKIFDRLFAEFELRYVSAMVQVKTKQEYEMQELICVLFSETLQRALKIGLIEQEKVDAFDPALMFSIPRLAIIAGLVVYPKGPLNMDMPADVLSEMFRPFRTILTKIRDLLRTLTKDELYQLQKLLCTNEDINLKIPVGSSSIEAPISADHQHNQNNINNNNNKNESSSTEEKKKNIENNNDNNTARSVRQMAELPAGSNSSNSNKALSKRNAYRYATRSPSVGSSISADSSIQPSTPHSSRSSSCSRTPSNSVASSSVVVATDSFTSAVTDDNWSDDDEDDDEDVAGDQEFSPCIDDDDDADSDELSSVNDNDVDDEIAAADCASGYLIPNTNFGNLLQPQEIPLAGNFVASDDEFVAQLRALGVEDVDLPTTSGQQHQQMQQEQLETSQRLNRLRLTYSSEESDRQSTHSTKTPKSSTNKEAAGTLTSSSSCGSCIEVANEDEKVNKDGKGHRHNHHHHHHHHCYEHCHHHNQQRTRNYHSKSKKRHHSLDENAINAVTASAVVTTKNANVEKALKKSPRQIQNTSSADGNTSSSLSDGEATENARVLRTHGRMKFKSTENLLHRLFVCIAGVADQLQTNFASDLRQILRSVFLMNMSMTQDDLDDIPDKQRESELFEFRASENDVIQQRSGGSNQSIYSAEEANAELDNVFNNNNNNNSNSSSRSNSSSGSSTSNGNYDADNNGNNTNSSSSNHHLHGTTFNQYVGRSRSVSDQATLEEATSSRRLSSFITEHRLSTSPTQEFMSQNQQQQQQQQESQYHNRKNSMSSNSATSFSSANSSPVSSQNNSPLSDRASAAVTVARNNNNNNNNNNNHTTPTTTPRRLSPPAWIPDDKAPRCMSCRTPFTAFRRRHHCRNCGGVFCGVCSNASTPLPKYGLTKAVRVCRDCYMREILSTASANANQYACTSERRMHATNTGATTTAGGS